VGAGLRDYAFSAIIVCEPAPTVFLKEVDCD